MALRPVLRQRCFCKRSRACLLVILVQHGRRNILKRKNFFTQIVCQPVAVALWELKAPNRSRWILSFDNIRGNSTASNRFIIVYSCYYRGIYFPMQFEWNAWTRRIKKDLTVDCFQGYCETTYRVSGYMYVCFVSQTFTTTRYIGSEACVLFLILDRYYMSYKPSSLWHNLAWLFLNILLICSTFSNSHSMTPCISVINGTENILVVFQCIVCVVSFLL